MGCFVTSSFSCSASFGTNKNNFGPIQVFEVVHLYILFSLIITKRWLFLINLFLILK